MIAEDNVLKLEYNTGRGILTISEHGRHVQKLIAFAKNIQNDEYRQSFVESIINLMEQMNPSNKNVKENRERLWKHLFRIANYDIKVTPPDGLIINPGQEVVEKVQLPYPQKEFRYRHYGHYIQQLVQKAIDMDDVEKKAEFVKVIAFYMKLAYRTWNQDQFVNDDTIKSDLRMLSKGKLSLDADHVINTKSVPYKSKNSKHGSKNKNNRRKKHSGGQKNKHRNYKRK